MLIVSNILLIGKNVCAKQATNVKLFFAHRKSNKDKASIDGVAYVPDVNEPNRLLVEFPEASRFFTIKGNYNVWSTDYQTYSLVYSCKIFLGLVKFESAWILARSKNLDETTVNTLKATLRNKGIDVKKFTKTKQTCDEN